MLENEREDTRTYVVVLNHEEQYSIWFGERPLPLGWRSCEKTGTKQECLNYINEVWTDMRPLSVRQRMESVPG
jgi:MbtH protein